MLQSTSDGGGDDGVAAATAPPQHDSYLYMKNNLYIL